jgi:hypothetical protein
MRNDFNRLGVLRFMHVFMAEKKLPLGTLDFRLRDSLLMRRVKVLPGTGQ